ncbi:MAG: hypothetical protein QOG53_3155 [Frankiales bacterium]|jgi:hypothetical protein|nr:hypothetical protein [Frankiales bacterium]
MGGPAEPGGLADLDEAGLNAWQQVIAGSATELANRLGPNASVVAQPDERTPHSSTIDWIGLPLRVVQCIGRHEALSLLDWRSTRGDVGRRRLQEEYIEWRVVSDDQGIARIELTTELSDYWKVLAAHAPERTLEIVGRFARESAVPANAVYGDCDPFASATTPEERAAAFTTTMLEGAELSPYNSGLAAICCMVQSTNALDALLELVWQAATSWVIRDELSQRLRCLSCMEAIPLMAQAAQAGRASDPLLVERVSRLAFEGRLVALDDPVGVYIQSVELTRLRTPDRTPISLEWCTFDRGLDASYNADGRPRWQRLTIEPPPSSSWRVSDLIDSATEEPIRHGGQIADLVQVALFLRMGDRGSSDATEIQPSEQSTPAVDLLDCAGVRSDLSEFQGGAP